MKHPGNAFFGHNDDADDYFDDDGTWDSPGRVIGLGVVLPILILTWIALDIFWWGGVHVPGRRTVYFFSFSDEADVAVPLGGLKACVAAACAVSMVIGNHPTWGWHKDKILLPILIAGIGCVIAAFVGAVA